MMYLSKEDIENIGDSVIEDYTNQNDIKNQLPVDIERFARSYLGLNIEYQKLSDNGKILGLTSYMGVVLELSFSDGSSFLSVPEDTILLDTQFTILRNQRRKRFTIAHECAHQILARIEENINNEISCRRLYTSEDWVEWQANSLGAVLLIPRLALFAELNRDIAPFKPTIYGDRLNTMDYKRVKRLSDKFGVSVSAMKIRLKELGCMIVKPEDEFIDPLDITYE
jgi:Predicted Zn peptidase